MTRKIRLMALAAAFLTGSGAVYWHGLPRRPRFVGRNVAAMPALERMTTAPSDPPLTQGEHERVSNASLLLRNTTVVNDPRFGFETVVAGIFQALATSANPAQSIQRWRDALDPELPAYFKTGVFRLLGIVNRADLAHPTFDSEGRESGNLQGTEVRFEYGAENPANDSERVFFIVEIVLADPMTKQGFQEYVRRWMSLAMDAPDAVAQLLADEVLRARGIHSARIRLLGKSGSVWPLRQYNLQVGPATADWVRANLDREFPRRAHVSGQPTECLRTWVQDRSNICAVLSDRYDFENAHCEAAGVLVKLPNPTAAILLGDTDGLDLSTAIASGQCQGSPIDRATAESALKRNACSRCHSAVHNAEFSHLSTRTAGQRSKLSAFLTGKAPAGDSFFSDVPLADENPGHPNDLLRRHLFARRILELNPTRADWGADLRDLRTVEVH